MPHPLKLVLETMKNPNTLNRPYTESDLASRTALLQQRCVWATYLATNKAKASQEPWGWGEVCVPGMLVHMNLRYSCRTQTRIHDYIRKTAERSGAPATEGDSCVVPLSTFPKRSRDEREAFLTLSPTQTHTHARTHTTHTYMPAVGLLKRILVEKRKRGKKSI